LYTFNTIADTVSSNKHGFFFVSGYGGTGKTFLWNTIIAYLRSKKIVPAVATSGVASLLLPGGCTSHSRFKIPCALDEATTCNIKRGTMLELIQSAFLIIWDEAFMTHRTAFEALDRTFRDLLSLDSSEASNLPFGGKVVVLGGYARQILPVIEGGSCAHILDAAITNSPLWSSVTILHLTENMRLSSPHLTTEARNEIAEFSKWILDIGEGNIEATTKDGEIEPSWIKTPHEFLLMHNEDNVSFIVNSTYLNLSEKYTDPEYFKQRAVLTPTNAAADAINDYMVSIIPGDLKEYASCDKIAKGPSTNDSHDLLYPVEFPKFC
jgi:hypothetical protein